MNFLPLVFSHQSIISLIGPVSHLAFWGASHSRSWVPLSFNMGWTVIFLLIMVEGQWCAAAKNCQNMTKRWTRGGPEWCRWSNNNEVGGSNRKARGGGVPSNVIEHTSGVGVFLSRGWSYSFSRIIFGSTNIYQMFAQLCLTDFVFGRFKERNGNFWHGKSAAFIYSFNLFLLKYFILEMVFFLYSLNNKK